MLGTDSKEAVVAMFTRVRVRDNVRAIGTVRDNVRAIGTAMHLGFKLHDPGILLQFGLLRRSGLVRVEG